MSTTREAAPGAVPPAGVPPGDRSMAPTITGLRWWATLLLALVLTVVGVSVDLVRLGQLGIVFMICFPVGCVLAVVWARRSELFGPMVQPPLLLVVVVPVAVAGTGSLPRAGGLVSTVLAVGGPLINAFPTLAVTTAVCLAVGFVRWRLQPYRRPAREDPPSPGPTRPPPTGAPSSKGTTSKPAGAKGPAKPKGGPPTKVAPARPPRPRDDRPEPGVYRVPDGEDVERPRRPGPPR